MASPCRLPDPPCASPVPAATEGDLVARVRAGDGEAYAALVGRYQGPVERAARRIVGSPEEAAEVAQDAFVRAYTRLDRFDAGRPFGPWIFKIAVNLARNRLRDRKRRASAADPDTVGRAAPGPMELAGRLEIARLVRAAVSRLGPRYRRAVVLHYLEERSCAEIAERFGAPVNTVKTWLHRAREILRRELASIEGIA